MTPVREFHMRYWVCLSKYNCMPMWQNSTPLIQSSNVSNPRNLFPFIQKHITTVVVSGDYWKEHGWCCCCCRCLGVYIYEYIYICVLVIRSGQCYMLYLSLSIYIYMEKALPTKVILLSTPVDHWPQIVAALGPGIMPRRSLYDRSWTRLCLVRVDLEASSMMHVCHWV